MRTAFLYHGLHENGIVRDTIIQDTTLLSSNAKSFIGWLDKWFGSYPLWMCPVLQ